MEYKAFARIEKLGPYIPERGGKGAPVPKEPLPKLKGYMSL